MFRGILFVSLILISTASVANTSFCEALANKVNGPEDNYRPPLTATVIGKGRVYFYTAPHLKCPMKGVFVIKGDSLTIYKPYKNWVNVMYIAQGGQDFIGWIPANRIKLNK